MRGLKADSVFIDEVRDFVPYGSSPLVKLAKTIRYFQLLEQYNTEFFQGRPNPFEALTRERVTPAASERPHVEQQAEEENVQLPPQVER